MARFPEERTGADLNEDNAAILVTHFAVAAERACCGEGVGAMAEEAACEYRPRSP
ncbi:MAG: hypothetical protein LBT15_07140 [Synergistaceae bacterium]|nr:hypothetical protein [Synergistaceae bacterium]